MCIHVAANGAAPAGATAAGGVSIAWFLRSVFMFGCYWKLFVLENVMIVYQTIYGGKDLKEPMSLKHERIPERVPPNPHNLNANHGVSISSFLFGSSSNVSSDLQHLLDPKAHPISSQASLSQNTNGFSAGTRVSELSGALWPVSMDSQNWLSREVSFPLMPSNSITISSNNPTVNQAANLNFQNTHKKDKVKSFSSLIGFNNAGPIPANSWNPQKNNDLTALLKAPVVHHHSHNLPSSLPHVFCSGISGNLLLSDTGLLGVVCACHGLYMSISKFSEHSGLYDLDPGSAVRMNNGVTIAHWWKTFSDKSGIRLLEGRKRWDWPEGISPASASTNHPIPNNSNNSVSWNELCSFKTSVSSDQLQGSVLNTKGNGRFQNISQEYAHHEKGRNSQECTNYAFKNFINVSQENLPHASDKQMWGVQNPFDMNIEKASHSSRAKLESVCGSSNSLLALPSTQDFKTPFTGFDVRRNTCSIVERLGVPSNTELRLGEPPGQSQTLETKTTPYFVSNLNGIHEKPPNVLSSDKLPQRSNLLNVRDAAGNKLQGSKLILQNAGIASSPIERREPTQLEHSVHGGEACGTVTDSRRDSSNSNFRMTHRNPLVLSCLNNPETKWQFESIYGIGGNNCTVNKKHQSESHVPISEKSLFPWGYVAGNIKESHTMNKGKNLVFAANGYDEFSNMYKEDLSISNPVLGERHLFQSSNRMARDDLNNYLKISSLSDVRQLKHDQLKPLHISASSKESVYMEFTSKSPVFGQRTAPTVSKDGCGIKPNLQNEKMRVPGVHNMVELCEGDNDIASIRYTQACEVHKNLHLQTLKTISPSIPKGRAPLLDSSRMPKIPEVGEQMMSGTICWVGNGDERHSNMTERSQSTTGACDLPSLEQFFVSETDCNSTLSKKGQCSHGLSQVSERCISAVQENCSMEKFDSRGDNYCSLVEGAGNGAITSLLHDDHGFQKASTKSLHSTKNLVPPYVKSIKSHPFQWKDVPKKLMESCSSTKKELQVGPFNTSLESPRADVVKCFTGCAQHVVPLKEHDVSIISSTCSASNVAQSFIEINKKNSSTTKDRGDVIFANSLVLDEESKYDRSWSCNDAAVDNEICPELFSSASRINFTKRGPLEVFPREPSLGLMEEISNQSLFKSEYFPHQPHKLKRSSIFEEECEHGQKFDEGSENRRRTVNSTKLDALISVSCQSSINNNSPKCTEEVGQNNYPLWKVQMPDGRDEVSPSSFSKQLGAAFSAAKELSLNRELKRVEQNESEADKCSMVDETLETFEMVRKKRLRLDNASVSKNGIRETCCSSTELTTELTSLGSHCNSQGKPNVPKRMKRPIVFGEYGIISNGSLSKPTKIVSLRKILKATASPTENSNKNGCNNDKQDSIFVKVKETSAQRLMGIVSSKKFPRGRDKNSLPIEAESLPIETIGNDDLSYTLMKSNSHCIGGSKFGADVNRTHKEGRKRSLHELLTKGTFGEICIPCSPEKFWSSGSSTLVLDRSDLKSVSPSAISSCRTPGKYWEERVTDAVDTHRVQKNEVNNAKRCSRKHQPDKFCHICQSSDQDGCDKLIESTRSLIKGLHCEAKTIDATSHMFITNDDNGSVLPEEKSLTCARAEGYKGRKREGFLHNQSPDANGHASCLVPQEQLNAWMHIHRQKPQRKGRPKLPSSVVESDYRKAYVRHKHSKGWKHLVVYKSGIHALGLYTSQFISCGAMVVEYVGEIVGARVADRREKEYHSGKKMQHKAVYVLLLNFPDWLFSLLLLEQPNCIARVICVRNEKKVVFFAERDIYPGEEITYDYHFSHEDEGEKIPCYCNSENCRRFLN
ncbi:histone-lysine N-methyltransferase trr [Striga asiatica]|uniref:Histone-lysine N-methyltransferase trr n=1 Tax=Striga asiatica TaxID=4170 RepID=A0A5A7R2Q0_STRAF|nr:histone-lysine N-methyltransferase trr [Striga asiatica]